MTWKKVSFKRSNVSIFKLCVKNVCTTLAPFKYPVFTQPVFTCLKSTIETLEQSVKSVQSEQ